MNFDLTGLEYKIQEVYDLYLTDKEKYAEPLFLAVKNLTYAVLRSSKRWISNNRSRITYEELKPQYEEIAYEYAVYLLERMMSGRFLPTREHKEGHVGEKRDKFAWQSYININLRHIINSKFVRGMLSTDNMFISIDEMKEFYDDDDFLDEFKDPELSSDQRAEKKTAHHEMTDCLSGFLKLLYKDRYYVLVSQLLCVDGPIEMIKDEELKNFCKISSVLIKRVYESYQIPTGLSFDIDDVLSSTLFLASIMSSNHDRRLYTALDFENLYRLSVAFGGETIKVPRVSELEALVAGSKSTLELLNNAEPTIRKTCYAVKKAYKFDSKIDRIENSVRNTVNYICIGMSDSVSVRPPIIKALIDYTTRSEEAMDIAFDKFKDKVDMGLISSKELLESYQLAMGEMARSFKMLERIKALATYGKKDDEIETGE